MFQMAIDIGRNRHALIKLLLELFDIYFTQFEAADVAFFGWLSWSVSSVQIVPVVKIAPDHQRIVTGKFLVTDSPPGRLIKELNHRFFENRTSLDLRVSLAVRTHSDA